MFTLEFIEIQPDADKRLDAGGIEEQEAAAQSALEPARQSGEAEKHPIASMFGALAEHPLRDEYLDEIAVQGKPTNKPRGERNE